MQKKNIISTYLSLANYVADTIAIEIKKNYKNLNIKSYKKTSPYQVVTNLDLKIEKIVRKLIHSKFPDHNIIGEELGNIDKNSMVQAVEVVLNTYSKSKFEIPIEYKSLNVSTKVIRIIQSYTHIVKREIWRM